MNSKVIFIVGDMANMSTHTRRLIALLEEQSVEVVLQAISPKLLGTTATTVIIDDLNQFAADLIKRLPNGKKVPFTGFGKRGRKGKIKYDRR